MARVLADDASLNYNGTEYFLDFRKTTVYDAGGNNNGRLDPGESANLTSTLRNIGGSNFIQLTTSIYTTDPYITITDNSGYFGLLAVDSIKENTDDPYSVSVSSNCPQGHIAQFRMVVTDGWFLDTIDFSLVIGSYHYLVWNPDPIPSSGQAINNILTACGYTGNQTTTLLSEELDMYRALFICLGIYPNNYRISASSPEVTAITNYLNNGGRIYMEGGDVWYYDPQVGGYNFGPLFGLTGISDGTSDMGPVQGIALSLTQGMLFNYSGENGYMDHLNATGGSLIFKDQNNNYNCGVAYSPGTYRTIGTSFELGGLVDGSDPSTKAILLDTIMHFFGVFLTGIEENNGTNLNKQVMKLYPNPIKIGSGLRIQFGNSVQDKVNLKIYNTLGSCVKTLSIDRRQGTNSVIWDGKDNSGALVPAGIYFVGMNLDNKIIIERVVLVN